MNDAKSDAKAIFLEALDCKGADHLTRFLEQACGTDAAVRGRVEELLRAHQDAGAFLGGAAEQDATRDQPISERPGTVIGPYKLLEQIGEGGFGLVFMAEQQQPVRRKVALKILKPGMDTRQVIARFEAERQALALMDHPNIARVLDAGTTEPIADLRLQITDLKEGPSTPQSAISNLQSAICNGRPYFVMELIKGVPITDYCDQNRLATRERLELFAHICLAVQHAHHKGIIHRDIKPSNVMVTLHDEVPVVKVIDFGIAKALGQQLTDKTLYTGFAQMCGTPMYMSPEQAGMSGLDIDTRSDIYSLGVLLYELLTGMTPFDKERLSKAGYDEMRRIIREEEPARPSTRLSTLGQAAATVSERRHSDPKRLSLLLRGELDWIVMKALDKDRNRRYETAGVFAADVQRYLHDEPVAACPPSAWYRFRKFARRRKVALRTVAAAAVVLLLAVVGVSWALWDQATRRTETEQTVSAALIKTDQWRKQAGEAPSATSQEADAVLALWRQAQAALDPAETALRTGTPDDRLRQQVLDVRQQIGRQWAQSQRQAKLLRDLDGARMTRSIWSETHFDFAGAATKYAAAFAAYGLEVKPGRTEELARRIRAEQPPIREALIVALDDCWDTAAWAKTAALANLVQEIAAAADDDPWRRQYRAAATARDATALRALSGQARQLSLPPSSLRLLALSLRFQGDRDEALDLLRWARGRHPTDFWIPFELALLLHDGTDTPPVILEETIGCYRTALALRPAAGIAHNNLGICLRERKQLDEAMAEFRTASDLDPKFAPAHNNLGVTFREKNQLDEAMAEYRTAIDLDPKYAPAHLGLGNALAVKKQWDEAMAEYRTAIDLDPRFAPAHFGLGNALTAKKQWDEAMAEYRTAIDLDPKYAPAHHGLGNTLTGKKQWDEAIAEYRTAIDLDPKYAPAHFGLGSALKDKKQWDEAIAEYRTAIDLDPKYAPAHFGVGYALATKKQWDEAIAAYRTAIDLDPKYASAHCNLGNALWAKDRLDEAMGEYRKAIDLDPKCASARYGLGNALKAKNRLEEASAEYRQVIDLQADLYAEAHCNLASVLRLQGQFSASLDFYKRGHALGSKRQNWHYRSDKWVATAERLVRLEAKLPDVLAGPATATDNRERLGLLEVCRPQRRHGAAARLYADAFTTDPKLADDLKAGHRYDAACFAALAAAGQGTDADKLNEKERTHLRQQALAWLRADLEQWSKRLEGGKPEDRQVVRAKLEHWQRDTDLARVRDADAPKKLSAEEQEAWRKLWADVAELLKKAGNAK